MQIEYVDAPVERTKLSKLSLGDTFFLCDDKDGNVNMFLYREPNGEYMFMILGDYPELVTEEEDCDVQIVKTRLLVEI